MLISRGVLKRERRIAEHKAPEIRQRRKLGSPAPI